MRIQVHEQQVKYTRTSTLRNVERIDLDNKDDDIIMTMKNGRNENAS